MTRKAMGLHIHSGSANMAAAFYIAAARPAVVKWLDHADPTLVDLVHRHGGLTILRVYVEHQDLDHVDEYLRKVEQAARNSPVKAIEVSFNEAHQAGDELSRKAIADIAGMKMAERIGKVAVIGSFSVGMPDIPEWHRYRPALEYAAAHGHLLGIHEYGGGSLGMDAGVEGSGKAARGWYCLRYRRVLDWAKSAGIPMPKIVITEGGIDDLSPAVMPKTRGWQTARDLHPAHIGDYADQALRYSLRLSEDDSVIGWVDFGWASEDPAWHAFDLSRDRAMLERLARLQGAIPESPNPTPPAPPKEAPMLEQYLNAEFGVGGWDDLRASLPANPNGPAGDFSARQLSLIDTIAVHHSAGSIDQSWQTIAAYHIGPERKWAGIGYHIGVRNGRVAYLGGIEKGRACVGQLNHRVICVCVTGDYTRVALAQQDRRSLERVVKALQRWSAAALQRQLRVKGHGELPGQSTACPGGAVSAILPALASITSSGGGVVDAGPSTALLTRAEQHRVMRLNKAAALQKVILRDGFVPVSGEFTEAPYTAQLAESLATGVVRVYYASPANWNDVRYLQR